MSPADRTKVPGAGLDSQVGSATAAATSASWDVAAARRSMVRRIRPPARSSMESGSTEMTRTSSEGGSGLAIVDRAGRPVSACTSVGSDGW